MHTKTNFLILGSGMREHALAWKLNQSKLLDKLHAIPGNQAMDPFCQRHAIPVSDYRQIRQFIEKQDIDIAFIGPYDLLTSDIVEYLAGENLRIISPQGRARAVATNRTLVYEIMRSFVIPTPAGHAFENIDGILSYIENARFPLILKTDAVENSASEVCQSQQQVKEYVTKIINENLLQQGNERIIVENYVSGPTICMTALVSEKNIMAFPICQLIHNQYQTVGACVPAPVINVKLAQNLERVILVPWVHALNQYADGYTGIICLEIVITQKGPCVVDFKMQWDPLISALLLNNMRSDFLALLWDLVNGGIGNSPCRWHPATVSLVAPRSMGFHSDPQLPEQDKSVMVFTGQGKKSRTHADNNHYTTLTANASTPQQACTQIADYLEAIHSRNECLQNSLAKLRELFLSSRRKKNV